VGCHPTCVRAGCLDFLIKSNQVRDRPGAYLRVRQNRMIVTERNETQWPEKDLAERNDAIDEVDNEYTGESDLDLALMRLRNSALPTRLSSRDRRFQRKKPKQH